MTVIYRKGYICEECCEEPPLGCLYRCVADKDALLLDAKNNGHLDIFDDISRQFADQMSLGKFGPDRRSREGSLFHELSDQQRASYTWDQLSTLMKQRDNVRNVIAHSRHRVGYSPRPRMFPHDDRPWVPNIMRHCKYTICHACHKMGREKSWVSLNAVLNGDILPHVATGYAFGSVPARPVVDANILRNIGCRADAQTGPSTLDATVPRHAASNGPDKPVQKEESLAKTPDDSSAIPRSLPAETVHAGPEDDYMYFLALEDVVESGMAFYLGFLLWLLAHFTRLRSAWSGSFVGRE